MDQQKTKRGLCVIQLASVGHVRRARWWSSIRLVEILLWTTPFRELEQMKGVHSDKEYTAWGTQTGITTVLWQLRKKETSVKHKIREEYQAELWQKFL